LRKNSGGKKNKKNDGAADRTGDAGVHARNNRDSKETVNTMGKYLLDLQNAGKFSITKA